MNSGKQHLRKRPRHDMIELTRSWVDIDGRNDVKWGDENRSSIELTWDDELQCFRCPYVKLSEDGYRGHCDFQFKGSTLQNLNKHRIMVHNFKLADGEKGIMPVRLLGKPNPTMKETCRREKENKRKLEKQESVILANVPDEVLQRRQYSRCGYEVSQNRQCTIMKCLYRFCSVHMKVADESNIEMNEYPNPEHIKVNYYNANDEIIEAQSLSTVDLTYSTTRILSSTEFIYGDAITTYETAEPVHTEKEKDDKIPSGKKILEASNGYGSWIRECNDANIANCSVEYDEVLEKYIVRCNIARIIVNQELRIFTPTLAQSRRSIYSCHSRKQEAMPTIGIERPRSPEIQLRREEESVLTREDLHQYLISSTQQHDCQEGILTVNNELQKIKTDFGINDLLLGDVHSYIHRFEGIIYAHHILYKKAEIHIQNADNRQAIGMVCAMQVLKENVEELRELIQTQLYNQREHARQHEMRGIQEQNTLSPSDEAEMFTSEQHARQEQNTPSLCGDEVETRFRETFTRIRDTRHFRKDNMSGIQEQNTLSQRDEEEMPKEGVASEEIAKSADKDLIFSNPITSSEKGNLSWYEDMHEELWRIPRNLLAENVIDGRDIASNKNKNARKTLDDFKADLQHLCNLEESSKYLSRYYSASFKDYSRLLRTRNEDEIAFLKTNYFYVLEPILEPGLLLWRNDYYLTNIENPGGGHCLYYVLAQGLTNTLTTKTGPLVEGTANLYRSKMGGFISEDLVHACFYNNGLATSLLGEFFYAIFDSPSLKRLWKEKYTSAFKNTPLKGVLSQFESLSSKTAGVFDKFFPLELKKYWICVWHKLIIDSNYWGHKHDIALASVAFDVDIILWQHCSGDLNLGESTDPDPQCIGVFKPTYPSRFNSKKRWELNIIHYPRYCTNKFTKTLYVDEHYELLSVNLNCSEFPFRENGYCRRSYTNNNFNQYSKEESNCFIKN